MPTLYPAELDEFVAPPDGSRLSDVIGGRNHSQMHADLGAAIMAIQATLGTTDSIDANSIEFRMRALEYVPLAVSLAGGGTYERGQSITSRSLTWTVSKALASQSLPGAGALDPADRATTIAGPITSDTTWTLTATATSGESATASTSLLFRHRRRWGTSATATPDTGLIDALASTEFATSRAQSRTMSPSAEYLYFAWPASFGTPTFTVNGLAVTGWVQTTISYTNPSGDTTSFDVWRSPYPISGTFAVVVT